MPGTALYNNNNNDYDLNSYYNPLKRSLSSMTEETFSTDFVCCGSILEDMHQLLQHVEDKHTIEEEVHQNLTSNSSSSIHYYDHYSDYYNENQYNYLCCNPRNLSSPSKTSTTTRVKCFNKSASYSGSSSSSSLNNDSSHLLLHHQKKEMIQLKNNEEPPFKKIPLKIKIETQQPTQLVDKPYKCIVLGCNKSYKNVNGLKYHMEKGICCTQKEIIKTVSSLNCVVENCSKGYKSLNGLKYHIQKSHPEYDICTDDSLSEEHELLKEDSDCSLSPLQESYKYPINDLMSTIDNHDFEMIKPNNNNYLELTQVGPPQLRDIMKPIINTLT